MAEKPDRLERFLRWWFWDGGWMGVCLILAAIGCVAATVIDGIRYGQ